MYDRKNDTILILQALTLLGWTVNRVRLRGIRGDEGWVWSTPYGDTYTGAGKWSSAPEYLPHFARQDARESMERKDFWIDGQGNRT